MFKKTLAGLAVAGLFSGAAMAADVNVYGVVDLGLMYQHTKQDVLSADDVSADKDNSFTMKSGQNAGSRFGLRGSEDLGNGLTVSFKLENGFDADSGKLGNDGRLFGREAQVTLAGAFGQVSFGRMGGVASAAGTYDYVFANGDAFDGFDNSVGALVTSSRYDNMITYQTPEFGGMKVLAQYSFKNETVKTDIGSEGKSDTNRYASLAAAGQYGNLNLVAAYELQNFAREDGKVQPDDQHTFYVGGNYDFGVTKVFGMAQHFAGARSLNGFDVARDTVTAGKTDASDGFRGWGATIGAQTPVAGGLLTTAFYYVDASVEGKITNSAYGLTTARETVGEADYNYYGLAARYEYSLSKRTTAYAGAGYAKEKVENEGKMDADLVQAYVGLKHTF